MSGGGGYEGCRGRREHYDTGSSSAMMSTVPVPGRYNASGSAGKAEEDKKMEEEFV